MLGEREKSIYSCPVGTADSMRLKYCDDPLLKPKIDLAILVSKTKPEFENVQNQEDFDIGMKGVVKKLFSDEKGKKINWKEFEEQYDERFIFSSFKEKMCSYGWIGGLRNFSLTEVENIGESDRSSFFSGMNGCERKIFVISADYSFNQKTVGKIHGPIRLNMVKKGECYVPRFGMATYIQVPKDLSKMLSGKKRGKFISSKNSFEKMDI